jgi:hypothetical protein
MSCPRGNTLNQLVGQTLVIPLSVVMLAPDFFVTLTASFRMLYVFVALDVGTRRSLHWNVTEHPTAGWTVQHFRRLCPAINRTDF